MAMKVVICVVHIYQSPLHHDLPIRRDEGREGGEREGRTGKGAVEGNQGMPMLSVPSRGESGVWLRATLGGVGWNMTHTMLSSSQGSILH